MSLELDEHRQYLDDAPRVAAFARAIAAAVRPGDVVVDLGCGTGILGLLACRAGAARVYGIDAGDMAEVADALAAANGYGDRITILRGHSQDVSLPERADLIVSDQIGRFGFDAGVLEYFADAQRRFLRPGGRLIPRSVSLWVAPIECPDLRLEASFWSTSPAGFDMTPAQTIAWNSGYPRRVERSQLLADGICAVDLATGVDHRSFTFAVETIAHRAGVMDGIAGWFTAELDGGASLTNAPGHPDRINRRNAIFPASREIRVAAGDRIRVQMQIRPVELLVKWTVEHGGRTIEHSTFNGMLFSPELLQRTRPGFVPRLTERGRARKLVLDLADGRSCVADIERSLFQAYPQLFPDIADAGRFVAEVVTRYAE